MSRDQHILSIVEARDQLTRLPGQFEDDIKNDSYQPVVKVTKHNKPVLAILPWELYESIIETLEILGDDEQVATLRQGIQEATENKGKPWKTVKKELGWEKNKETPPIQSLETT
jgi:antitoxin YefM